MGIFQSKQEKILDFFGKSYRENFFAFVKVNANLALGPSDFNGFHQAALRNAAYRTRERYRVWVDAQYFDETYREIMLLKFPWGRSEPNAPTVQKVSKTQAASCSKYKKGSDGICAECGVHWFDHDK